MGRIRVLSVNLHLTEDGALVAIIERRWRGASPDDHLLRRVHIAEVNIDTPPPAVLHAVAALLELQTAFPEEPDPLQE